MRQCIITLTIIRCGPFFLVDLSKITPGVAEQDGITGVVSLTSPVNSISSAKSSSSVTSSNRAISSNLRRNYIIGHCINRLIRLPLQYLFWCFCHVSDMFSVGCLKKDSDKF